ncbi:MAG: hypothetical protein FJW37_14385, partial [Acidobacteria bacterium]|nr:hypothetical protein [Acidobacteriota bacterium]
MLTEGDSFSSMPLFTMGVSSMKKNLLLGVSCLLAAAAGGAAGLLAPEAGSAYLYFRSRAGICTLRESLRSMRATLAQHHNFARMQSESRILERDPAGLDLYDTPRGRYWSPRGSENALFNQLAEQERAVYRA